MVTLVSPDSLLVVLKSLINMTEYNDVLFQELQQSPLILDIEKTWLSYIQQTWEETNKPPTEQLLKMQFPQLRQQEWDEAEALTQDSLSVYLDQFNAKRQQRELSRQLVEMSLKITQDGVSDEVRDRLHDLQQYTLKKEKKEYQDPFDTFRQNYIDKKDRPRGLKTYVPQVDEEIGGLNEGTLNTILGFTSSFKTTFALNIIYNNLVRANYKICMLSIEMPKGEVSANLLGRHSYDRKFSNYPFLKPKQIREATLPPEHEKYLFEEVIEDFKKYKDNLVIFDQSDFDEISFANIERKFAEAEERMGGFDCFIVDHLNLFKFSSGTGKSLDEKETMNRFMNFFREQTLHFLHKEKQVTGIVLVQANREGHLRAVRNDGEYGLQGIAEANEVERASYRVLTVFSDEDLKLSKELKIGLIKHRGGNTISPPILAFCEPEAGVVGEAEGFDDMPSMEDFGSMFDSDGFSL